MTLETTPALYPWIAVSSTIHCLFTTVPIATREHKNVSVRCISAREDVTHNILLLPIPQIPPPTSANILWSVEFVAIVETLNNVVWLAQRFPEGLKVLLVAVLLRKFCVGGEWCNDYSVNR